MKYLKIMLLSRMVNLSFFWFTGNFNCLPITGLKKTMPVGVGAGCWMHGLGLILFLNCAEYEPDNRIKSYSICYKHFRMY